MEAHEAETRQLEMAARVRVPPTAAQGYTPRAGDVVIALDIQYVGDAAHVGADVSVLGSGEVVGTFAGLSTSSAPYVPGLFCFREGPPLRAMLDRLAADGVPAPAVIVVDGHGLAHPRRFGVACWLGVEVERPVVGCAKSALLPQEAAPAAPRGSVAPVLLGGDEVGRIVRTQDGIKPLYVSVGSGVHLDNAVALVLSLPGPWRLPDPLRRADQAARARSRGESTTEFPMVDLGALEPS